MDCTAVARGVNYWHWPTGYVPTATTITSATLHTVYNFEITAARSDQAVPNTQGRAANVIHASCTHHAYAPHCGVI